MLILILIALFGFFGGGYALVASLSPAGQQTLLAPSLFLVGIAALVAIAYVL